MWVEENNAAPFGGTWNSADWNTACAGGAWKTQCWSTTSSGEAWCPEDWITGDAGSNDYLGTPISPWQEEETDSCTTSSKKIETETTKKMSKMMKKTKMCSFYMYGKCSRGEECMYAHHSHELQGRPNLKRTSLCPQFMEIGYCEWIYSGCEFAHGHHELRGTSDFFKTKMCPLVSCGKGPSCRYAHGYAELREKIEAVQRGDETSKESKLRKPGKKSVTAVIPEIEKNASASAQPRRNVGKNAKEKLKKNANPASERTKKDLYIIVDEEQCTEGLNHPNAPKWCPIGPEQVLSPSHSTADGKNSNEDENSWYQKMSGKEKPDEAELPTVAATPTSVNEFSTLLNDGSPTSSHAPVDFKKELVEKLTILMTRPGRVRTGNVEAEKTVHSPCERPEAPPWDQLDFAPQHVPLSSLDGPQKCDLPQDMVALICDGTECDAVHCVARKVCLAPRWY